MAVENRNRTCNKIDSIFYLRIVNSAFVCCEPRLSCACGSPTDENEAPRALNVHTESPHSGSAERKAQLLIAAPMKIIMRHKSAQKLHSNRNGKYLFYVFISLRFFTPTPKMWSRSVDWNFPEEKKSTKNENDETRTLLKSNHEKKEKSRASTFVDDLIASEQHILNGTKFQN